MRARFVAPLCGKAVPLGRLEKIGLDALPVLIKIPEPPCGFIALPRRGFVPFESLGIVLLRSVAEVVGKPRRALRGNVALFRLFQNKAEFCGYGLFFRRLCRRNGRVRLFDYGGCFRSRSGGGRFRRGNRSRLRRRGCFLPRFTRARRLRRGFRTIRLCAPCFLRRPLFRRLTGETPRKPFLRKNAALLGGEFIPLYRLGNVLGDAPAVFVTVTEVLPRHYPAVFCRSRIPFYRRDEVFGNALAVFITFGKAELRRDFFRGSGFQIPFYGFLVVP